MPEIGDVLDGYRLDAVVGRGGMGTVYRATDLALEQTVALKVIAPHLADDDTFVQRFREEAKALARLDADGIVDVYTMRETDAALFFVMEHIEGPSLDTVLRRHGALDPPEALSLLRQVLTAVGHAHDSGVLHRDLKPSNILLDDGQAVITDFGLAKILASDAELTATHDRLGTVAYMSPEQVEGLQHVGEASDLFSVGLVAYEALTGRLPFDRSESDYRIQRAIIEESFPPPSAYAPDVPPAVASVVRDLLAKDPTDRPDAATALRRLPEPSGDAPTLPPTAPPSTEARMSVRQWGAIAGVVLAVLAGVYVGVRVTLGLSPLSLSPPSPADTTQHAETVVATSDPPSSSPSADSSAASLTATDEAPPKDPDTSRAASPSTTQGNASRSAASSPTAPDRSEEARSEPPDRSADAAPSATEPTPQVGHLTVRSTPGGAAVHLGDSLVGRTPVLLDSLAPTTYRVGLTLPQHRPAQRSVEVSPGDTARAQLTLSPRPAVVQFRVRPAGTVRIDGRVRAADTSGVVVDSLAPGAHRVALISRLGRWETRVQLDAGERYERTVDFSQRIEVAVTARTPSGRPLPNATVTVDGRQVGYTPQRLTLRVGRHTLRVTKNGYEPAERTVQLGANLKTPIVVELSPRPQ